MRATYVTPSIEALGPIVDIEITASSALRAAMRQSTLGPRVKASSLIDTGATGTALVPQVFQRLGIHPHDAAEIRTPGQPKPTTVAIYHVDIFLLDPKGARTFEMQNVRVIEALS